MAGHASSTTWGTHLLAYASRNHAPPPCIESHPLYYNLCHATRALLTCKCILSWVVWRYFSRSTNCGEEENQSFIQYFCLFAWLHNLWDLFSSAATTDRKHIWSSFRDPLWLNNGILATIKPSRAPVVLIFKKASVSRQSQFCQNSANQKWSWTFRVFSWLDFALKEMFSFQIKC